MINVKITVSGAKAVSKFLKNLEKQSRFAMSLAMNRTVFKVRKDVQKVMPRIFDRPTSYTLNSIRYTKAKKNDLMASVFVADEARNGTPPIKWLSPHIYGGARGKKPSEGHLPGGFYMVPGKGVRLNKFGNVTKGTTSKILSSVRAQDGSGSYFSGTVKGTRGIWQKKGRRVHPIFIYVATASYPRTFKFHNIADKSATKHFPGEMDKAIEYAIRTAK